MNIDEVFDTSKHMMQMRRSILHRLLKQCGLHLGQPEMLLYVQENPGCSQRQMAEDAGVSAASIAASFKRMENAGLIRRRSDTADLRCNRVYITERGEKALNDCKDQLRQLNRQMLQGLDEEEIDLLLRCLEKINRNLSALYDA